MMELARTTETKHYKVFETYAAPAQSAAPARSAAPFSELPQERGGATASLQQLPRTKLPTRNQWKPSKRVYGPSPAGLIF